MGGSHELGRFQQKPPGAHRVDVAVARLRVDATNQHHRLPRGAAAHLARQRCNADARLQGDRHLRKARRNHRPVNAIGHGRLTQHNVAGVADTNATGARCAPRVTAARVNRQGSAGRSHRPKSRRAWSSCSTRAIASGGPLSKTRRASVGQYLVRTAASASASSSASWGQRSSNIDHSDQSSVKSPTRLYYSPCSRTPRHQPRRDSGTGYRPLRTGRGVRRGVDGLAGRAPAHNARGNSPRPLKTPTSRRWPANGSPRWRPAHWAAITWPPEFGGRAATARQQLIFYLTSAERRVPPLAGRIGLNLWPDPHRRTAHPNSSNSFCRRCSTVGMCGVKAFPNPGRAPTLHRCAPAVSSTATAW